MIKVRQKSDPQKTAGRAGWSSGIRISHKGLHLQILPVAWNRPKSSMATKDMQITPPNITPPGVIFVCWKWPPRGGGVIFGQAPSAPMYFLLKTGGLYLVARNGPQGCYIWGVLYLGPLYCPNASSTREECQWQGLVSNAKPSI